MCGIAGLATGQPDRLNGNAVVDAMCAQIVHRGPDDQGIYHDSTAAIGMRRLSIIDLSGGHQPIHNEDESVWLVFNGEIYNYRELRQELEAHGHRFYTNSDSEAIVHAYEQYGAECFSRLRGMFAIALWDKNQKRLLLGRDRLGKKPLYWTTMADGGVAFASELKSLLVLGEVDRTLDSEAVRAYMMFGYVPTPRSIFKNVHKLEPGHWLEWQGGRVRTQRYWSLPYSPKHEGDEQSLTDRLEQELDEAVRIRLVSDVPFGAFLSGGLDSSVVAALMARHMREPVRTFTIGFSTARYDETADARRVAKHIGARHEELIVEADAVSLLEKLVWHLDEPFADSSAIPTYLVSQLAARHVKMVLSGDGGDEAFAGYSRYKKYRTLQTFDRLSLGLAGPSGASLAKLIPGGAGGKLSRVAGRLRMRYPENYLSGVALLTPERAQALLCREARGPAALR